MNHLDKTFQEGFINMLSPESTIGRHKHRHNSGHRTVIFSMYVTCDFTDLPFASSMYKNVCHCVNHLYHIPSLSIDIDQI